MRDVCAKQERTKHKQEYVRARNKTPRACPHRLLGAIRYANPQRSKVHTHVYGRLHAEVMGLPYKDTYGALREVPRVVN